MNRIQANIVNRYERRFLDWCCKTMPEQITADHLTLVGVLGALLVPLGYVASRADPRYLWLACLGYVLHWAGDSLDSSLARYRQVSRPRYGYFMDHSVDALCILLMIGGMGLSAYVRLDVALFVVIGYFALSIHVFLKNHVSGTFQLSFMALGPTEMRIVLLASTIAMFVFGTTTPWAGQTVLSAYDIVLLVVGGILCGMFVISTAIMTFQLRALEGDGRRPLHLVDAGRKAGARASAAEVRGEAASALRGSSR